MASPAKPAQPIQPGGQPFQDTGGYMAPSSKQSNYVPKPIPGPTPPGATSSMGAAPSSPPVGPGVQPQGPVAPPGGPQGASNPLGIDQKAYDSLVAQMSLSTDPDTFRTQFQALHEQKQLIATPEGVDPGGNYKLSREQKSFFKNKLNEAVQYASAPKEAGGLGYSPNEARLHAIMEAKKRWPRVPVWAYADKEELGAFDAPEVKVGDTSVEFGPKKSARLDPNQIGTILTRPELKQGLEWAEAYKSEKGTDASAKDFARYVIDQEVANRMAKQSNGIQDPEVKKKASELGIPLGEDGALDENDIKIAAAKAEQQIHEMEAAGDLTNSELLKTQALIPTKDLLKIAAAGRQKPKGETAVRSEVNDWFLSNLDVYSVAAALGQLY